MSIFICEKCGCLDKTALNNNYWHAAGNKHKKKLGEDIDISYAPQFSYFEDHVCCSDCCHEVTYKDGSGGLHRTNMRYDEKQHWSQFGKEKLLEWERRKDGSMVNATEYFQNNGI